MQKFDVLIIGSGLAGLTLALELADTRKVGLVTKRTLIDSSSSWAQGGIAAVLADEDSVEDHIQDTLVAGAGLCDPAVTEYVVRNGRETVNWLIEQGVPFTRDQERNDFHLTREGGHSRRRIIHAADATGYAVQNVLGRKVRQHPNITVLEDHIAVDLVTGQKLGLTAHACLGVYALEKQTGHVVTITAQNTVLACGGLGKVYLYTTNPDVATGDGVAMAWRAGCRVANMEFIQFHPTCLFHPKEKTFLITEAIRGEGGFLKLPNGQRFMNQYDERAELAPRDIVARAIDYEMKKRGLDYVLLDISHQPSAMVIERFPTIYQRCLALGMDLTQQAIPVVPAVHFSCGGIMTDLHGQTDVARLYAIGENAYTGLHGANRLASNSLLECMVSAHAAARHILSVADQPLVELPDWDESRVTDADEEIVITQNWDELRRFMWNYVGIVRTNKRLDRALNRIQLLKEEVNDFYRHFRVSNDLIELRNLLQVAELIVRSAMSRRESRGLHYSKDYPDQLSQARPSILVPPNYEASAR